ncbi:MAG: hypothetical protein AB8B82_11140 [Roseovarius sp.]
MLIEFAGISGSGKTTVFQKLTKGLRKSGADVVRFHKAAKAEDLTQKEADQAFRRRYPGLAKAIKQMGDGPSYELKNAARARHVWMSGITELDKLGPSAIGAVDEGYLHRCAYIAATGKGYNAFIDILDQLPLPDILVLVHVPLEEARRRFVHRMPTPDRRDVAAQRFDRRYTDHRLVRDFFEDALKVYRKKGVAIHRIDNSGDVDGAIGDLVNDIMQLHSKIKVAA